MRELRTRKRNRLEGYDYSRSGSYFITICVKDGHEMLAEIAVGDAPLRVPHHTLSDYGTFVDAQIRKVSVKYPDVVVDNYVIMPNHIHMIVTVDGTRGGASPTKATIPRVVQSLKSITTKQFGFNLWQRSYHDHIVRDRDEFNRISEYIDSNPMCWKDDCF